MTAATPADLRWLDAAVRLATQVRGTTADNPAAAALVVNPMDNALVARAVTARGGHPHAEAVALDQAGFDAAGATLYVTLEPCASWGRSPPCVDAIVRSGVMRVVIGMANPDPEQRGVAEARLESAGVEVVFAHHAPSAQLHAGQTRHHATQRPFVTAVLVVARDDTLLDPASGAARDWLDLERAHADAIVMGAAGARTRPAVPAIARSGLETRTPLRVVLAGASGVDRRMSLIGGFTGHRTAVIAETNTPVDAPVSVEVIRVAGKTGRPDLTAALAALAKRGARSVQLEPGPKLLAAMLEAELVDAVSLVTLDQAGQGGPPATPDGRIADLLLAADLMPEREQGGDGAKITIYRRSA
ncbi:bifunctional diaminohydroxyphosphoribosylaminopyrimidine deaminase/5-amino-6-(5-phosphoribosylamino)uracil reductase RibD [Devosia sp. FKR38]|uniref:bifunctional diaminohydroxyphosphoribosylaminopyrimidine deaminase/5-amino-6-(5-phosphoribosylamino)uracil reductase RibD n=1 Tax=Devosia sp. FKR38 TaxID=2562312 RepID=UPI0010C14E3A|nr:bifunctional diaminohydroxyphosphoribosylaminopyrimidine deaminase/5-amino-6-(5-phosphoribosylamino)uracil reductase RibD [Devosia sp. FKR38]